MEDICLAIGILFVTKKQCDILQENIPICSNSMHLAFTFHY